MRMIKRNKYLFLLVLYGNLASQPLLCSLPRQLEGCYCSVHVAIEKYFIRYRDMPTQIHHQITIKNRRNVLVKTRKLTPVLKQETSNSSPILTLATQDSYLPPLFIARILTPRLFPGQNFPDGILYDCARTKLRKGHIRRKASRGCRNLSSELVHLKQRKQDQGV